MVSVPRRAWISCQVLPSVLDPEDEISAYMPEPGGLSIAESTDILMDIAAAKPVAGAGLSGLSASPDNVPALARVCSALGL